MENELKALLSEVVIPESGKDIVSLGFVKSVSANGPQAEVNLEIPVSQRRLREFLHTQCDIKLKKHSEISTVKVNISFQVESAKAQTSNSKQIGALKDVSNIIAIASGKGGVGKSTVTANLACALADKGAKVGVMDLDIYGPSMNMMFGIDESPRVDQNKKLFPVIKNGIKIVSMAMFSDEDSAVIWRGPMVSQMVQNFLMNVNWGELDFMLLDLPPGTGDIQLTLTQMAPLTGALIVTTPQEVSLLDAKKGLRMFEKVSVPVLGIVENMSRFIGDDGKAYFIFQQGGGKRIANSLGVPFCGEIPIHPEVSKSGDIGTPIVWNSPKNPVSEAYQSLGLEIKNRLNLLNLEDGVLLNYDFSWDSMPNKV